MIERLLSFVVLVFASWLIASRFFRGDTFKDFVLFFEILVIEFVLYGVGQYLFEGVMLHM